MRPFESRRNGTVEDRLKSLELWLKDYGLVNTNLAAAGAVGALGDTTGEGATPVSGGFGGGGSIPPASTVMAGDVTGSVDANTVEKVRNVSLTAPVAGDDGQFLRYTHSGPSLDFTAIHRIQDKDIAAPAAGDDGKAIVWDNAADDFIYRSVTTLTLLGAWTHASAATLTGTDAEIANAFAADSNLANAMPVAGALVGLVVKLSGDVGGVGQDVIVTVYKEGVETGLTATITGGAGTETEAIATVAPITFAAGNDITVQAKANGTPTAVRVAVQVYGRFTV